MNSITPYVPRHQATAWQHIGDVTKRIIKQAEERYFMDHYSQGFEAWMQTARAGDRFIYFRGVTPEIRPDSFKMAYKAERAGYVSLTQRKCHAVKETSHGPVFEYEYLAEKV